jgi:hypothetical protein
MIPITYILNLFIMQYKCVPEMHGTTVRHVSSIQILEESMKKWILGGYVFLAVALSETEVLSGRRTVRLPT